MKNILKKGKEVLMGWKKFLTFAKLPCQKLLISILTIFYYCQKLFCFLNSITKESFWRRVRVYKKTVHASMNERMNGMNEKKWMKNWRRSKKRRKLKNNFESRRLRGKLMRRSDVTKLVPNLLKLSNRVSVSQIGRTSLTWKSYSPIKCC